METVRVSQKFQVVIPPEVRNSMKIKPGEKLVMIQKDSTIHLIPVSDIRKMRGFVKGVTTKGLREEHERFD
jgi:AbrB family looped-hinge helix DNA binding protein